MEILDNLRFQNSDDFYNLACFYSLLSGSPPQPLTEAVAAQARADADRAVAALRQAVAAGFADRSNAGKDTDLPRSGHAPSSRAYSWTWRSPSTRSLPHRIDAVSGFFVQERIDGMGPPTVPRSQKVVGPICSDPPNSDLDDQGMGPADPPTVKYQSVRRSFTHPRIGCERDAGRSRSRASSG